MAPDNQSHEKDLQHYLRRILDALPDCWIQLSEAGDILDVNRRAVEVLGYSREELAGRPLTLLMPDESVDEFRRKAAALRAGETIEPCRKNLLTRDHRLLPFEIQLAPTAGADGDFTVHCLARDRRHELETERLLQASRELFRALIHSTVDLIFVKDRNNRYTLVNQAFLDWFGRPENEVVGRTDVELFGEDEGSLLLKKDRPVLLHGQTVREDDTITTRGKAYHFDCTKAPIRDPNGRIIGLVGVARDVTTEHALAQQLAQTQKMEAIGTLAGGVAHDFNNLLTALIGHLTAAVAKSGAGDVALPHVRAALRTAESTAELTQRLLHLAKSHPAAFVPLTLPELIDENVDLLRSTADRRLRVNLHFEPDLWPIRGDRSQIRQAFANLLHNAQEALECRYGRHFEAPGAQPWIEITARNLTLSGALTMMGARHAKPGDYVRLTVSDNGLGIAPENLGRVFEPFFDARAQAGGGGLGLAMVYAIVSNHGGWITVESERDMGSDFIVHLPRAAAAEKTKAEGLLPFLREDLRRHKILVIDDEIEVRHLLQTVLREHGFEVLVAENGAKGWEALQDHRAEVDLIVLDLIMPEMPGRHFVELLRKEGIQIPVLICTGYPSELAMTDLSGLEVEDFLGKPFTPVQFLEKVNDMITRRAATP